MAAAALAAAAIVLLGWRLFTPSERIVELRGYALGADDRHIVVTATMLRLDTFASATAQENDSTVTVVVRVRGRTGTAPADLLFVDVPITLAKPLGTRVVLDANGTPLPLKTQP